MPRITAPEAIAFALQIAGRNVGPQSDTVKLVLSALTQSGWKIVPRDGVPLRPVPLKRNLKLVSSV
jgi:hypothetical protein